MSVNNQSTEIQIHNALFALDDVQESVDTLEIQLKKTGKNISCLQGYLEDLLDARDATEPTKPVGKPD